MMLKARRHVTHHKNQHQRRSPDVKTTVIILSVNVSSNKKSNSSKSTDTLSRILIRLDYVSDSENK